MSVSLLGLFGNLVAQIQNTGLLDRSLCNKLLENLFSCHEIKINTTAAEQLVD